MIDNQRDNLVTLGEELRATEKDVRKTKVTSDTILEWMKEMVESRKLIPREMWLEVAFKLNLLRIDEAQLLNKMYQAVKLKELESYKSQEKKNKSAAELEVQSTDEYRLFRDQEDKLESIDQFIMIAKKNSDNAY